MREDAEAHEDERRKRTRVEEAKSQHAEEEERRLQAAGRERWGDEADGRDPAFVTDLAKRVYSDGGGLSVAERVQQGKHYNQRDASAGSFLKR